MSATIQAHGGAGVHSDLPLAGFYAYARSSSHPSPLPSKPETSIPLGKGAQKKTGKSVVFCQTGGGLGK